MQSPSFQLGTAALRVGGSAGRPSFVSSLNRKPAIRIAPFRWGRTAGSELIASAHLVLVGDLLRPRLSERQRPVTDLAVETRLNPVVVATGLGPGFRPQILL